MPTQQAFARPYLGFAPVGVQGGQMLRSLSFEPQLPAALGHRLWVTPWLQRSPELKGTSGTFSQGWSPKGEGSIVRPCGVLSNSRTPLQKLPALVLRSNQDPRPPSLRS